MPQMAPISWLSLFLIFSMTFMLFNIMNYFSFLPKSPSQSLSMTKNKINSLNWKW